MSGKSYRRDRSDKKKKDEVVDNNEEKEKDTKAAAAIVTEDTSAAKDKIKDQSEAVNSSEADNAKQDDVINIEQMEKEKEAKARETLDNYLADFRKKNEWKQSLKNVNTEAANNRSDDDKQFYKLDSSLKKNTAFIKKCKTFSDGQKTQLTKEMSGIHN